MALPEEDVPTTSLLCKAEFELLFTGFNLQCRSFRDEKLLALRSDEGDNAPATSNCLEWQRSFEIPGSVPQDVIVQGSLKPSMAVQRIEWMTASSFTKPLRDVLGRRHQGLMFGKTECFQRVELGIEENFKPS